MIIAVKFQLEMFIKFPMFVLCCLVFVDMTYQATITVGEWLDKWWTSNSMLIVTTCTYFLPYCDDELLYVAQYFNYRM